MTLGKSGMLRSGGEVRHKANEDGEWRSVGRSSEDERGGFGSMWVCEAGGSRDEAGDLGIENLGCAIADLTSSTQNPERGTRNLERPMTDKNQGVCRG